MKTVAIAELASLSVYLTGVVVSHQCLQAESFTSFSLAGLQSRGPQRRTRIEAHRECDSCRQGTSYVSDLPSTLDSPITSPPPNDVRVARLFMKSFVSAVLSAMVVLGGPDVFRIGEDYNAAGLCSLRPHAVMALTEEQEVINDVWRVVNAAYVDQTFNGQDWRSIRMKTLKQGFHNKEEAYAATKGMLNVLGDPFTRFLTPKEYETMTELARGGVAGVGLELAATPPSISQPSAVVVAGVVDGSPADRAGVMTGDLLTAVNGNEAVGIDLDTVASLLRGNPGSSVRVDVRRGGKTVTFPLKREQFKLKGVTSKLGGTSRGNKVGVVTIKSFSKDTFEDVRDALELCLEKGAESILLDLRHNPGGFFPGGIDVARLFLQSEEPIVSVVDRHGISDQYSTVTTGKFSEIPLILVVDEKTASAAEILSAALKDNGRAKLAGHKTFGKAKVWKAWTNLPANLAKNVWTIDVQTLNQIFDGSGVAVTISLYRTPSGADINGRGIPVDYPSNCPYPGDALACIPEEAWT